MIDKQDAVRIIVQETNQMKIENRDIVSCLGKVLAEDIYSRDNLPNFDKSAMDGYAIRSSDSERKLFKIKGIIRAGDTNKYELKSGETYKIMTGAALPFGADAVIEKEKVHVENGCIFIENNVKKYNNTIKYGEEIRKGDLALERGTAIRPAEIGFMASLGYSSVNIYGSPKIAILLTGDELVDIESSLTHGKIRNSNGYSLKAMIDNVSAVAISYGIIPDDKKIIKFKIEDALKRADIVIISGGASAGDYDFVEDVLEEIGAHVKFSGVAVKPGKPVTFAEYHNKLIFSLPGNPLSLINSFEEFVKPAIYKMMGRGSQNHSEFPVILRDDFHGKIGREKNIYVKIVKHGEKYYAFQTGSQCSNTLYTLTRSNGVVIVPKDYGSVKAGSVLNGKFIFR
ncbi:molybdopterin molybdenumtransferase MoeA [Clostridium tyrobutyricum]|jgi:molybdopterin molybdotransferase|uniref:Molybdopterin molybdenumtransferase n=1 Tax=Clostridium tyrobutyricum DIVETGP TaxID=1408889 RepID=W6N7L4_CLOTY|nr:gephyrin-like molybdotransferase Glp [Clostridium tyrobutyricum]AND83847.1 molybdopterin molybdotransferase [Clostridium tyrobutyricum]ANP68599.1 molybdopterin molybdenumtransferase MoeA [Clostridium tyrobutyricum]MBV4415433.1 molybdopterin molybdotransferase MoeA [Clostridium tyrobutyricum]MBV4431307.1 molybdopterin molybdotransferase MoeA [Clostridium tyrobutyricum]MBV4433908.1 molybdopterin molybdotransferase MoeA [Clostridium tyrobutyricum]